MDPIFPRAHADVLVGQVLPGGLRVLEPLGRTALGPLYRAQYATGPSVALVLLDPPPTPRASYAGAAAASKLVEQLRRACQINHPNVAGLMELGEAPDGRTYAVAEFLSGKPLSDLLVARGALPPEEAADICLQAAAGLNAAHQLGIVHGEISPRTILVAQLDGSRPLVKLVCFNLDSNTEAGRTGGRADPRYSSPERLAGGAADRGGDVFSLGGVLHHLLTGEPPGNRLARKSVPQALARVVDRALASSPDRRYRTVSSFAEELADAVRVFRRPRRSRWRRTPVVGVIGAGILAVGVWFGWSRYQTRGAGARAEQEVGMRAPERADPAPARATPLDTSPKAQRPPVPARTPAAQPVKPIARPNPRRPAVAAMAAPPTPPPADSGAAIALSPFRRAHPWAADPEGRFYFPSSCPLALQSRELLYFTSESEARATGRSRSTAPGCS